MNFDQECKSEEKYFFLGCVEGGGGGGGIPSKIKKKTKKKKKKKTGICLFCVLLRYIKFQVPSSSASLVLI